MIEPPWHLFRGLIYGTVFIILVWHQIFYSHLARASEGIYYVRRIVERRARSKPAVRNRRVVRNKQTARNNSVEVARNHPEETARREASELARIDSNETAQNGSTGAAWSVAKKTVQSGSAGTVWSDAKKTAQSDSTGAAWSVAKKTVQSGSAGTARKEPVQVAGGFAIGEKTGESRLSDKPTEFHSADKVPERPPLLIELGDPFLHQGNLNPGFELPGGAVWQPRLWIFGTLRTAIQSFDNGVDPGITEWASRFDLFANLQLTGTEKILVGIRPLDRNRFSEFTRYSWSPENSFRDETNVDIRTLFFEGDFGSLFPFLDPKGTKPIDFGFSVGRQPLVFQDGILINDTVDAVGVVRNNIHLPGVSNLRATAVYGWGELDSNRPDPDATMIGLFLAADLPVSTVEIDGIYVKDDGQGNDGSFHFGASATQRIGELNTTFRANASTAEDRDTVGVSDGVLLSAELSFTPHRSDDNVYFNAFWAIDNYTQAGREPVVGGPLATFGILFASVSLGNYLSELSSRANEVAGGALGYQAFWDQHRKNLVFEIAGRFDTSGKGNDDIALGIQYQQKLTQRLLWQIDTFYSFQDGRDDAFGGRMELLYQF